MAQADETYAALCRDVLDNGEYQENRTGVGAYKVFGRQMRFDLRQGEFPLLTTKRVWWYGIVHELLWFLRGETNIKSLQEAGVHIWDEWADENGDLGPVYGSQWRSWPDKPAIVSDMSDLGAHLDKDLGTHIDQIAKVVDRIRKFPQCRRLIVSAWNPAEIDEMKLPPCHCLFQFDVTPSGYLNLQLYQRSADLFLGVPFNIASYALLLRMVAHVTNYMVGEFIWTGGNVHIYENHVDQVREQLSRPSKQPPAVGLTHAIRELDDFTIDDIYLVNYDPHPPIKAEVAV